MNSVIKKIEVEVKTSGKRSFLWELCAICAERVFETLKRMNYSLVKDAIKEELKS